MDSSQPAQSTLDTLRTVEFRLGLKGYNVDEVDEYLEKAAVEAEGLHEQLRQSGERLRQASERIAQLEAELQRAPATPESTLVPELVTDDSLQRTLLLAQKFVDQTRRESESEAAEIVSQAEERARTTVAHAEEQAQQIVTSSEQRLRDEVSRLESMRGQLAGDVENMARHLESERNRLRSALSEVLKWVDENVQPANSLMALRSRPTTDQARPAAGPPPPREAAPSRPASPSPVQPGPVPSAGGAGSPGGTGSETAQRRPLADTDVAARVLDLRGDPARPPIEQG